MTALFAANPTIWEPSQAAGCLPPGVLLAAARLSDDAILVAVDRDGDLVPVWTNPALDRLFGFPPEHLQTTGSIVWELADDSPERASASRHLLRSMRDAQGGAAEVSLRRADNTVFVARLTMAPVHIDDDSYWIVTLREIDDRVW